MRSGALGEDRSYWVSLPASYREPKSAPRRYPVLYLLDGNANTILTMKMLNGSLGS